MNTVGTDLVLKNGAVSRAFLKAGGQALQDECNDYVASRGNLPVAGVVLTKPGAIPCKGIIHTVGSTYSDVNKKLSEEVNHLQHSTYMHTHTHMHTHTTHVHACTHYTRMHTIHTYARTHTLYTLYIHL